MSGCIYCVDNDILKKLATFDLFENTITLFNTKFDQIYVLETAKHKFKSDWDKIREGRSKRRKEPFINYERLIKLADFLPRIGNSHIDQDLFIRLLQLNYVDEGEAVLTAYAISKLQKDEAAQVCIFTGDKNYLRGLVSAQFLDVQKQLCHRFWCLEQLILRNIDVYGFEKVRDAIIPVSECDTAIKAAFGSGERSTQDNVVETLNAYIQELRQETGDLLHLYPHEN